MERLYNEFLFSRYGELTFVINDFGYFEFISKSDDNDVIAHLLINWSEDYESSLSIHLTHRDNVMFWFNLSEIYAKWVIKSFIFNQFNVSGSKELRNKLHHELSVELNHSV